MDKKSLFEILHGNSQAAPLAPLPSGNIGAGGSQPLQLGPQVADSGINPVLAEQFRNGMQGNKGSSVKSNAPIDPSLIKVLMGAFSK